MDAISVVQCSIIGKIFLKSVNNVRMGVYSAMTNYHVSFVTILLIWMSIEYAKVGVK